MKRILPVSRSLTIKQMAMVSTVSVVFIFIFVVILLFHFARQYNYHTAMQMEGIARTVRQPLSVAILKGDIPAAQSILQQINPSGIVARADVVLPDQFQALRFSFTQPRQIPVFIARLFDIPQQISLPLYPPKHSSYPQPLAYLVLYADSWPASRYVINIISTLTTSWLLLSLMLSIAISWCINRLMVHPLRHLSRQLNQQSLPDPDQPLCLPSRHHDDDEIGMFVRYYNQQQQRIRRFYQQQRALAQLPAHLILTGNSQSRPCLLLIHCETLNDDSLCPAQKQALLLAMAEKLAGILPDDMTLIKADAASFVLAASERPADETLTQLINQILNRLGKVQPLIPLPVRPAFSVSSAIIRDQPPSCDWYQHSQFIAQSVPSSGAPVQISFEIQSVIPADEPAKCSPPGTAIK